MSYEEIYKNLEEEHKILKDKYKELRSKYHATINKHITEKLEWLKQVGKLNDRIRLLKRGRKL